MWYQDICSALSGFVTKHACDRQTDKRTDGQTDGHNYDSPDHDSVVASRGKNHYVRTIGEAVQITVMQQGPIGYNNNKGLVFGPCKRSLCKLYSHMYVCVYTKLL